MRSFGTLKCVPLVSLATVASATYECKHFYVPISFEAPSKPPTFRPFENQLESVALLNRFTARNVASLPPLLASAKNITGNYQISTYCCTPHGQAKDVNQILTHGVGYDHTYWRWGGAQSQYNYVKEATNDGYPVLLYDRLGNGLSTKASPYTELQLDVETEVLAKLTEELKAGKLQGVSTPKKVVHVGHSFGSVITQNLIALHPSISDGIVLTGFSTASAGTGFGAIFIAPTDFHIAANEQSNDLATIATDILLVVMLY